MESKLALLTLIFFILTIEFLTAIHTAFFDPPNGSDKKKQYGKILKRSASVLDISMAAFIVYCIIFVLRT